MKRTLCFVVFGLFVASPAVADVYGTVSVSETGYHYWNGMTIHYPGAASNNVNVVTGVYELTLSDNYTPTGVAGAPVLSSAAVGMLKGKVDAFCIDIWNWAPTTATTYGVRTLDDAPNAMSGGPMMGAEKAAWLAELLDKYWNDEYLTGNLYGAALQAAVWEIVSENTAASPVGYNVKDGGFRLEGNGDVRDEANRILASIGAGHPFGGYVALSHPTATGSPAQWQDYVVRVPLPGAVLLALLGLGAAGLRLRRTE